MNIRNRSEAEIDSPTVLGESPGRSESNAPAPRLEHEPRRSTTRERPGAFAPKHNSLRRRRLRNARTERCGVKYSGRLRVFPACPPIPPTISPCASRQPTRRNPRSKGILYILSVPLNNLLIYDEMEAFGATISGKLFHTDLVQECYFLSFPLF